MRVKGLIKGNFHRNKTKIFREQIWNRGSGSMSTHGEARLDPDVLP